MSERVIKCEQVKTWNNKPIYGVHLSDGQGGESFQNIPVGTPVSELNIEQSPYGLKIKWNKTGASGGSFNRGGNRSGNESFALAYAKDYAVAMIGAGKEFKSNHVLALADQFYNWLEAKKKLSQPSQPVAPVQSKPVTPTIQKEDDLPF